MKVIFCYCYNKSLNLNPNFPETILSIGSIYFDSGNFEDALHYYLTAFDLSPETENLALYISLTYYKLGDVKNAKSYFSIALFATPEAKVLFKDICPEAINDPDFSELID